MKYLSNYTEQAQTDLLNSLGAFFAFSNKQFDEQHKHGIKYAKLGYGLICPVDNIEKLKTGLDQVTRNGIIKDVEENGAEKIIEREYFNYESQITMDTSDALSALQQYIDVYPDLFTEKLIAETFKKCWNLAVKNDWF